MDVLQTDINKVAIQNPECAGKFELHRNMPAFLCFHLVKLKIILSVICHENLEKSKYKLIDTETTENAFIVSQCVCDSSLHITDAICSPLPYEGLSL